MIHRQPDPTEVAAYPLPRALIHDLRTPLNHIIGYAGMLEEQAAEAGYGDLVPDLMKVRAAGEQLLSLVAENFRPENVVDPAPPPLAMNSPTVRSETKTTKDSTHGDRATGEEQGLLLVVDDIEANRDVLSRRLRGQGYAVDTAEDGPQALEMLNAGRYDLVFLDIMMPGIDGYEVLQKIKANDELKNIPVIMISALSESESVARCIEMGAEDYLPKPFNPTLLKARVRASLEKKRAADREAALFEQLRENYKRLEELEKSRDDLTYMIVHDLRTPLTSMIVGMQTLNSAGDLSVDQSEVMGIALAGGETLLSMINDLLEVEKSESEGMQLDVVEISVEEIVDSAVAQISLLAEGKQLNVIRQISTRLPPLHADSGKLRRTLVNLLGNAVKFTPSGGYVTIGARLSEQGKSVTFSISDTGEGIPPEAFDHIFEKFGQVESRQGGRVMSTGLGLTFCKLVVEAHGGEIRVESEAGEGSTFSFSIPLAPAQ